MSGELTRMAPILFVLNFSAYEKNIATLNW